MKPSDLKTFTKVEQIICNATQDYLSLGIALIEDGWDKHMHAAPRADNGRYNWTEVRRSYQREYLAITSPTFVRAYLRQVAKELKRSFIVATMRRDSIVLQFPKRKRVEPCYASFLLAPEGRTQVVDKVPLSFYSTPTLIRVTFQGDEGRKMFNTFLDRCRTDPEYKKALRTQDA